MIGPCAATANFSSTSIGLFAVLMVSAPLRMGLIDLSQHAWRAFTGDPPLMIGIDSDRFDLFQLWQFIKRGFTLPPRLHAIHRVTECTDVVDKYDFLLERVDRHTGDHREWQPSQPWST